jgi:ribosomal protein S18 acetylase RimI-like enzyme
MLAHTDLVFALVDMQDDRLVGFARVLTDTVYKAFVFDVIVHPDRRGRGLVRMLLDAILSHPQLAGVKHFELYCRPDVVELYRKWGFGTELGGQVFMRREGRKRG